MKVYEANRFGVAELDGDRVIGIEERPEITDVNNYILVRCVLSIRCWIGVFHDARTFGSLSRAGVRRSKGERA